MSECTGSLILDDNYNHIMARNVKIIANNYLSKFFYKGPNHRENRTVDYEKSTEIIITEIRSYV